MSYQEKRSILGIFSTILIFSLYALYVYTRYTSGTIELEANLKFWGMAVLVFVPVSVLARIFIEILFSIAHAAVSTNEDDPSFSDERDKLIELKSDRISHIVSGVGFLCAMVSLVLGYSAVVMLNIIFLSFNIGEVCSGAAQFYFYRRGF